MKTINIAIDGPGGAGKSSISKAIASELGFIHVDTGAMYRAIALYAVRNGCADTIAEHIEDVDVALKFIGGAQRVMLCGEDVTGLIRTPEVSMAASACSAIPAVRAALLELQRDLAKKHDVLMDGRDIGTVVLPDAPLKIFYTADAGERARRRVKQLRDAGKPADYDAILEDIRRRDDQDSHRAAAPLKQADDAVLLDTTRLTFDQAVEAVVRLVRERQRDAAPTS